MWWQEEWQGGGVAVVHIIHSVISNNKNNSRQCRLQRGRGSAEAGAGLYRGRSERWQQGGRRGLPAQCRQLETHYALTADCGQTSYSLCYCLFVSFFLFFSLFLSLYTLKYIPLYVFLLLCAACLFCVLFQPRFALPFVLALLLGPAFFYCFFLSAGVALCRSLSFFLFFHFFLFRKIHS